MQNFSIFSLILNKTHFLSQEIKVNKSSIVKAASKEFQKIELNQRKIESITKECPKITGNVQIIKVL